MSPDEKDFSNPAGQGESFDDIIDAEAVDASDSDYQDEGEYSGDDADNGFGDDDSAFGEDDGGRESGRDMKKFLVPGLILGVAVIAGAFMVMGGGKKAGMNNAQPDASWEQQAGAVPADMSNADGGLPQPAVNVNQADGSMQPPAIPGAVPDASANGGMMAGATLPPGGMNPDGTLPVPGAMDPNGMNAGGAPNAVVDPNAPVMSPNANPNMPADASAQPMPGVPPVTGGVEPPQMGSATAQPAPADQQVAAVVPAQPVPVDSNSPGYSRDTSAIFEMPPDAQPPVPASSPAEAAVIQAVPAQPTPVPGAMPAIPGAAPAPASAAGAASAPVDPSQSPTQPDRYYDGMTNLPNPALSATVGPRKVDPVLEPASKFVVVEKTRDANDSEALLVSASRALKLGRYDAAVDMFESLYKTNRRDPRVLMGMAVAYQHVGREDSAIKSYEELLDVDQNNADALVNMLGLLRKQYPEVALRRLMNLYSKYPNNAGIAAQIGVTQGGLGETDDALRYLNIASSIEPHNAQHMFNMAVVLDRAGRKSEAITYYQRALETDAVYGGSRSVPRDQIYDRLSALH